MMRNSLVEAAVWRRFEAPTKSEANSDLQQSLGGSQELDACLLEMVAPTVRGTVRGRSTAAPVGRDCISVRTRRNLSAIPMSTVRIDIVNCRLLNMVFPLSVSAERMFRCRGVFRIGGSFSVVVHVLVWYGTGVQKDLNHLPSEIFVGKW